MDIIIESQYNSVDFFSQVKDQTIENMNNGFYLIHDKNEALDSLKTGILKIVYFHNVTFRKHNFSFNFNEVVKNIPDKTKKYICLLNDKITLSNINKIKNKELYLTSPLKIKVIYEIMKDKDKIILFRRL